MYKRTLLMNLVILSALIAIIVPQIHADEKQADSNDSRVIAEVGDEKIPNNSNHITNGSLRICE